MVAQLGNGCTE